MIPTITSAAKRIGGIAVIILGWLVMAFAIGTPGIRLDMVDLGTLFVGFALLIGGFPIMIWAER